MKRGALLVLVALLLAGAPAASADEDARLELPEEPLRTWAPVNLTVHGARAPQVSAVPVPLTLVARATSSEASPPEGVHVHGAAAGWNELHIPGVADPDTVNVSAVHATRGVHAQVGPVRAAGPSEAVTNVLFPAPGTWTVTVRADGTEVRKEIPVAQAPERGIPLQGNLQGVLAWTEPPAGAGRNGVAFEVYVLRGGTPERVGGPDVEVEITTWPDFRTTFIPPGERRTHTGTWDAESGAYRTVLDLDPGHWGMITHVNLPGGEAWAEDQFHVAGAPPRPVPATTRTQDGYAVELTFSHAGTWHILAHDPLTGLHAERVVQVEAAGPEAVVDARRARALDGDFWGRAADEAGVHKPHYRVSLDLRLLDATGSPVSGVTDATLELPDLNRRVPLVEVPPAGYHVEVDLPAGHHLARVLAPSVGLDAANATWRAIPAGPIPQDAEGTWGPAYGDPDRHAAIRTEETTRARGYGAFAMAIAGGMLAGLLIVLRRQ